MADTLIIFEKDGCPFPSCTDGVHSLQVGEELKITLDAKNPLWPEYIIGVVTEVNATHQSVDYTIQFDDADLNGGPMFEGCDMEVSPYCCCEKLEVRVDLLENANASTGSVSLSEDDATGVITMTITDTAGNTVTNTIQDSTLTLDINGNLVDPAGNVVVESGKLVNTQYVANPNGTTSVTVDGITVLTTIVDTDTTYTINAQGQLVDNDGNVTDIIVDGSNVLNLGTTVSGLLSVVSSNGAVDILVDGNVAVTIPVELPIVEDQPSHVVAHANTAIASNQRYTLLNDFTIYLKP